MFPPDPPLKQIPDPEASKIAKNLTDQLQTISRPPDTNNDIDPLYSLAIAKTKEITAPKNEPPSHEISSGRDSI